MLRSIIVDDEPAARTLLQDLLTGEPTTVIGSYGNPRAAIEAILRDKPDLLFLDVEMPVLNGFDVLDALGDDLPPAVVFVTAFKDHAIEAFDVSAADYVLKPVDGERLHRAIVRAVQRVAAGSEGDATASTRAVLAARPIAQYTRVIPVGTRDRISLQRVNDIVWFEADRKYIRVHTPAERHVIRLTMQSLEARLDPERFIRVSRSAIVNMEYIEHIEPWSHGDHWISMRGGAKVLTTQGYRPRLRQLLRFE
ncbi:MAG: LytTr DNA-binding region [Gemmatimonadetes bacterium]|nr:LytTr DNA-binding region [Gemmatimonadota bacterium]